MGRMETEDGVRGGGEKPSSGWQWVSCPHRPEEKALVCMAVIVHTGQRVMGIT